MRAFRKDGNLVIEINEDALVDGVRLISESPSFKVTDREKYLDFCVNQFCDFGDSGDFSAASRLTTLIDDLVEHAAECDAGIGEDY